MDTVLDSLTGFGSGKMEDIGLLPFFLLMLISFLTSLFISFLYSRFYSTRATGSQVHRAFPLIGISITAIFITIQFSLPLSLGLLGALSIVRFRTPIKEPEEIGFIMLVISASLCCATFNLLFLSVLLTVSVVALLVLKFFWKILKGNLNDGTIIITLPAAEVNDKSKLVFQALKEHIPQGRIDSIADNNDDCVISFNFIQMDQEVFLRLQQKLKEQLTSVKASLFYNRQGAI